MNESIPTNPKTGEPYFKLDLDGFGAGWETGPVGGWYRKNGLPLQPGAVSFMGMHDDGAGILIEDSSGDAIGSINYCTGNFGTTRAVKW